VGLGCVVLTIKSVITATINTTIVTIATVVVVVKLIRRREKGECRFRQ